MPGFQPWAGPPFVGKRDKLVHLTRGRFVKLRRDRGGSRFTHVMSWCGLQAPWKTATWTEVDPITCLRCHGRARDTTSA